MNHQISWALLIAINAGIWGIQIKQRETIHELKQINKTLESFAEWNGERDG